MKLSECKKCGLYQNQSPLIDKTRQAEVMFVGLSAKIIKTDSDIPLDSNTNSGKIIKEIENYFSDISFYKTNLVKCVPLDKKNKLRYPNQVEINSCIENLFEEISLVKPKVIFLLGTKVSMAFFSNLKLKYIKNLPVEIDDIYYISIDHASYIYVYQKKNKEEYINNIVEFINKYINKR